MADGIRVLALNNDCGKMTGVMFFTMMKGLLTTKGAMERCFIYSIAPSFLSACSLSEITLAECVHWRGLERVQWRAL